MQRIARGWWLALAALVALACALAWAWKVPAQDELTRRLQSQAQEQLGVGVAIGRAQWQLLPPALVLEDVATRQPEPVRIKRLVARVHLAALLFERRLAIEHVRLDGAVAPQRSLGAMHMKKREPSADDGAVLLHTLDFHQLTWVGRDGNALAFDGSVRFDAHWRPSRARVVRSGVQPAAELGIVRQGDQDRWTLRLALGGGNGEGKAELLETIEGYELTGELATREVEVAAALQAIGRHSPVSGRASGRTQLKAEGATLPELVRSLSTRTDFTLPRATLARVDVDKAIRTAGTEHEGSTALTGVAGRMETQNSADGMSVRLRGLQAQGQSFSARGELRLARRQIDGELTVDLVGGLVGVPVRLSGPVEQPRVSIAKSVLAGAAAGTAVMPGVGTVIGAKVGAVVDKVLGR